MGNQAADPSSAAVVSYLNDFVDASEKKGDGPWINTTDYSTTLYQVPAGASTVPVYMDYSTSFLPPAMSAVPIPAGALPSAGDDSQMTIYQPSSDTLWEMFGMRQSLAPPPYLVGTVSGGGSLPAGSYSYALTALSKNGETTIGPVKTYTVPAGGKVSLLWNAPSSETGYRIYRGSDPAHLQLITTVNGRGSNDWGFSLNSWVDDGSSQPADVTPPSTNTATTPGQWHAQWGGRMLNVSQNPGYYYNVPNRAGGYEEYANWGATASSLPIAAGLITLADLASGHINHAIAMMVPKAKAKVAVCPARRTDGYDTSPNAIPEGAHFRLDPNLNLSRLNMSPITRMIAEAAQRYGLIVNDQTGHTVGFRAEDPTPAMRQGAPNPYIRYFTNPATGKYEMPSKFLTSFPWSHLQLLSPPNCL